MTTPTAAALTRGIHHLGLTVPDLSATRAFFIDALGYAEVGGRPEYPAVFLSDGHTMLTLWQAVDPVRAVSFDRRNVIGLHHVALAVDGHRALDALAGRLAEWPGVTVEFAPEPLGEGPARHMMCAVPGGLRVEFIATAA